MTNINSFIIVSMLLFLSCDKDNESTDSTDEMMCDVKEPLIELDWLKEIIERAESADRSAEVYFCTYDDQEGFFVDSCLGCPVPLGVFYDCEGNVLCEYAGYLGFTCPDFFENNTCELIWKYPL